jgi:hypothetical protein
LAGGAGAQLGGVAPEAVLGWQGATRGHVIGIVVGRHGFRG